MGPLQGQCPFLTAEPFLKIHNQTSTALRISYRARKQAQSRKKKGSLAPHLGLEAGPTGPCLGALCTLVQSLSLQCLTRTSLLGNGGAAEPRAALSSAHQHFPCQLTGQHCSPGAGTNRRSLLSEAAGDCYQSSPKIPFFGLPGKAWFPW